MEWRKGASGRIRRWVTILIDDSRNTHGNPFDAESETGLFGPSFATAIIEFLIDNFGNGKLSIPPSEFKKRADYVYFLHYSEVSPKHPCPHLSSLRRLTSDFLIRAHCGYLSS